MPGNIKKGIGYLCRPWKWFKDQVVRDVPEEVQLCEFYCRKSECVMDDWEHCERRLRSSVQGQGQV